MRSDWKFSGINGRRKYSGFWSGLSELVVNSCLENFEGKNEIEESVEVGPKCRRKEERMSGDEQWSWIEVVSPEGG